MRIEHIAIWVRDIERTRQFFETYFDAEASDRYDNSKGFSSYFLTFPNGNTRLEIMQSIEIPNDVKCSTKPVTGMGHIAFSLGSKETVDHLTDLIVSAGHNLLSGPRITGDGYYESCLCIFDDFIIELTV